MSAERRAQLFGGDDSPSLVGRVPFCQVPVHEGVSMESTWFEAISEM